MSTMQSLTYVRAGRFEWRERCSPSLRGPGEALVRPVAASICDIDRPLITGTAPWEGPFSVGHEAVGEVLDIADTGTNVRPGDLVAVNWHINCGRCDRCWRGLTAHCREVPAGAMYGLPAGGDWGGLFDDVVRVPYANAMLTPLPAGVDPVDAVAAGDNLSLGYQIVTRHLAAGARRFLILGRAAVGINQTAFAVALGAEEVVYVDDVESHRDVASRLGATAVAGPPDRTLGTFDVAIDASFNPDWLRRSLRMVEPEGTVECLGGYFGDEPLPLFAMYARGVTFRIARASNGPFVAPTLAALKNGTVTPSAWSQPISWEITPQALTEPTLKPVARRPPLTRGETGPITAQP